MHVRVDNRDGAACAGLGLSTTPSMPARPVERSSPVRAVRPPRLGLRATHDAVAADAMNSRRQRRRPGSGRRRMTRCRFGRRDHDGSSDELRSGSGKTQEGLGGKSALEGNQARLWRGRGRAPARLAPHRAYAGAARRREALEAGQRRAVRQHARRNDRQPGDAAGEGGIEGDLSFRLAGRGRRQHRRRDVSRSVALSGQLGAGGRAADQQRSHARRPDPAHGGQERDRLFRTDRSRRRSRASAGCSTPSS